MPKLASATVTAKYGPGLQATAKVISGIKSYAIDVEREVITFNQGNSDPASPQLEFDLRGVTTLTVAISAGNQTIVVS